MSKTKTVIIAGNFFFPDKNAAGKYNLAYGLMLKKMGYNPVFIGTDENIDYGSNIEDTYINIYGMDSYSMPYPKKPKDWGRYRSQYKRTMKIFDKYKSENIEAIIVFASPSFSIWTLKIRQWTNENNIKLIAHCAEGVRFTKRGLIYSIVRGMDEILHKKYILPKADGVIVGGPLLNEFFLEKGCKTIVFPTLTDTENTRNFVIPVLNKIYEVKRSNRKRNFIYAGIPFDIKSKQDKKNFKDRLDKTIELFNKVSLYTKDFYFNIYGLTKQEYLKHVPEHSELLSKNEDNIIFHGKVNFDTSLSSIINSDFYIFHREKTRINQSAFPTKVSEAISLGVPIITTNTSYIFDFVKHKNTGFEINKDNDVQTIINLIKLTDQEILNFRINCIEDKTFDYRYSVEKFNDFMISVLNNHEK